MITHPQSLFSFLSLVLTRTKIGQVCACGQGKKKKEALALTYYSFWGGFLCLLICAAP
jgi:hypothetical protein